MPEPAVVDPSKAPVVDPKTPDPNAPPAKPGEENEVPKSWDEVFKHKRFKELNDKATTAETELAARKAKDEADEQDRKIKAGEHLAVIEGLKPKAARADALEATINAVIDTEMAAIPKERQSLVPDLAPEKKLDWITKNREFLTGKKGNVNHPVAPVEGSPAATDKTIYTRAQINDIDFYEKNREAIKKAIAEGRVKD